MIENNFQGKDGQTVPAMSDEWVEQISKRYVELYEKLTGEQFVPADTSDIDARVERNVAAALHKLSE